MNTVTETVMRFFRFAAILWLAMLSTHALAQAETAYVTDQLQLGVHLLPDTSDKPFTKLKSGDRVTVQETTRFHALVTMSDGRKGWVKKTYLVADKPAVLRVQAVEQERDKARAELEKLRSGLGDRESIVAALEAKVAEREQAVAADAEELELLRAENSNLSARLDAYALSVPGGVFFVAVGVSLAIGLLLSWWWMDRRSRQRHGGYRIY